MYSIFLKNFFVKKVIFVSLIFLNLFLLIACNKQEQVTQVRNVIYTSNNLDILEKEIENLDSSSLVVFDIDRTLIFPEDIILRQENDSFRHKLKNKYFAKNNKQKELLNSNVAAKRKYKLVDEKILDLINKIENKGAKVLALSAFNPGRFGVIEDFSKLRFESLKKLSIDFSKSFDTLEYIKLESLSRHNINPVYYKGIIASMGLPKGKVLKAFLNKISWKAKKIIFLDDLAKNVKSVSKECKKLNIDFVGIYYTAADKIESKLDKNIAENQIKYLVKNGQWYSEQEIKDILLIEHDKQAKIQAIYDLK